MIRLHVLHDQIIRLSFAKHLTNMLKPLAGKVPVHAVHHRDLLIDDRVGIVGHAVWHGILPLKQVDFMVVHTDVPNVVCNVHLLHSSCIPFALCSAVCVRVMP